MNARTKQKRYWYIQPGNDFTRREINSRLLGKARFFDPKDFVRGKLANDTFHLRGLHYGEITHFFIRAFENEIGDWEFYVYERRASEAQARYAFGFNSAILLFNREFHERRPKPGLKKEETHLSLIRGIPPTIKTPDSAPVKKDVRKESGSQTAERRAKYVIATSHPATEEELKKILRNVGADTRSIEMTHGNTNVGGVQSWFVPGVALIALKNLARLKPLRFEVFKAVSEEKRWELVGRFPSETPRAAT